MKRSIPAAQARRGRRWPMTLDDASPGGCEASQVDAGAGWGWVALAGKSINVLQP